jgi:hypothetical protein
MNTVPLMRAEAISSLASGVRGLHGLPSVCQGLQPSLRTLRQLALVSPILSKQALT